MIWCTTNLHSLKLQKIFFFLFSIFLPILLIEAAAAHLSDPKKITKEKLSIVSISDKFISIFHFYLLSLFCTYLDSIQSILVTDQISSLFSENFFHTSTLQKNLLSGKLEKLFTKLHNGSQSGSLVNKKGRNQGFPHLFKDICPFLLFFLVNTWDPPGTGVWITSDRVGFHHSAGKRSGYGAVGVLC